MTAEPHADAHNIHDAKTNLSRIIDRVEHGEEIIISRAGTPATSHFSTSNRRRCPSAIHHHRDANSHTRQSMNTQVNDLGVHDLMDPTLQQKNRAEVLVDGPEIVVRPVRMREA